jgi:hypothetical protein
LILLKIKNTYTILFFVLLSFYSCAQSKPVIHEPITVAQIKSDSNFVYSHFIAGNFSYMDIDVLDNLYLISNDNQLKKLKPNGDSVAIFNDVKKFGNPTLIDVSNPLKILLYYKSYSTVVILDRFLSFRNSINFRKGNIFKAKTIATSYDNNIWLFDEQDFKLKKIKDDGTLLSETNDWRQIFDEVPSPTEMIDRDGAVYLHDIQKGFYVFDYYGSLKNNLPFKNWQHVAVANNKIMGFENNTLQSYELNTLTLKSYALPNFFRNYIDIKAMNGKVYLLLKTGVEVYNIR